jgi:GxxExxY protein
MGKVKDFLYEHETYLIRKACFNVWNKMGSAFKESAIDKALTIELQKLGFKVEDQKRIEIKYDGKKVGAYVPDKIINSKILLELKRKSFLTKQDRQNFWNYLRGSSYKLGLLVNFGDNKLEIKRVVYDKVRIRRKSASLSAKISVL